jgi:ERF superfamily
MQTSLDYNGDFLCVLSEFEVPDERHGRTLVKEWYPVHPAEEAGVQALVGRPVMVTDSAEGIYVDEEGNVFQLANKGETKPLEVERVAAKRRGRPKALMHRRGARARVAARAERDAHGHDAAAEPQELAPAGPVQMNLRQKLAEVRRRIGYIQKRGHNERFNYRYVTAADIAGAVGDIFAELGVVVIPRLESISHEPARNGRADGERLTHVVMNYSFADVDTAEEITVKVAGEGLDPGDKAPYKAMTGALKYALLQSFLLATGDDPEEERSDSASRGTTSRDLRTERKAGPEQIVELRQLIEETGTDLDRMLAYYKVSSLEEMTETVYRRAVELLHRKRAAQTQREASHAQG